MNTENAIEELKISNSNNCVINSLNYLLCILNEILSDKPSS